ncbi:unnamed protein product, partial [Amoebophrya sp. A25]
GTVLSFVQACIRPSTQVLSRTSHHCDNASPVYRVLFGEDVCW